MEVKSLGDYRFQDTENIKLTEIDRYQDYNPVAIYDEVQNILSKAIDQNFVPVTDDQGVFIGIVRRREILEFYAESASKVKIKYKKAIFRWLFSCLSCPAYTPKNRLRSWPTAMHFLVLVYIIYLYIGIKLPI